MTWDQIEGDWENFKDKVKEKWKKLSDDELNVIEGKKDRLVGAGWICCWRSRVYIAASVARYLR